MLFSVLDLRLVPPSLGCFSYPDGVSLFLATWLVLRFRLSPVSLGHRTFNPL